jgi:hypothetical protein
MRRMALVFALAVPVLNAQTTWTVDAQGGANFTTIQAAVQAAQDGDVVLVAPTGTYNWSLILTKALTILGSNAGLPTQATGTLSVLSNSSNGQVVISNFTVDNSANPAVCMSVGSVRRVIVSHLNLRVSVGTLVTSPWTVTVSGTSHFAMHSSSVTGGLGMRVTSGSAVTVSGCGFTGQYDCLALSASDSRIEVSSSYFAGGNEDPLQLGIAAPGIDLVRSTTVLAASTVIGGQGSHGTASSIRMDSASSVSIDGATLVPQGISGSSLLAERGSVTGNLGIRGTVGTFQFRGAAGAIGVLAVSFPGPRSSLPQGMLWLDPASASTLAIGPVPITGSVTVPAATLQGLAITLQGLLLYQGNLRLSPPLFDVVR